MKKVLLLGDSIRMGYCKYVRMAFEDAAEIVFPEDCCRFAAYTLRYLTTWKSETGCDKDLDVVHWNAGLWDVLRLLDGKVQTEPEVYRSYIDRICNVLKIQYPNARMIFATSTAVQEHLYGALKRYNCDIRQYNDIASEVVLSHGGQINDLYAVTEGLPAEYYSDATHFNTMDGTRIVAGKVISTLEDALSIPARVLDYQAIFEKQTKIIGM